MDTRPLLALTFALAACAHTSAIGPAGNDGDDAVVGDPATIEGNLQRLADLEVFTVGSLVLDVPDEAFNCYGPCPEWEDEIAAAEAAAAARLELFVDAAEVGAENSEVPSAYASFDADAVAADLATLASLEIVTVGSFLAAEPANNPSCYNLPCQEDIEAADDENCLRQARLHAIVEATEDL